MILARIIEPDQKYISEFSAYLITLGAKATAQPLILEVCDDFQFGHFHGIEKFNPDFENQFKEEIDWIKNYSGNFPFYVSLKQQFLQRGRLSENQMGSLTKAVAREKDWAKQKTEKLANQVFTINVGTVVILKKFFAEDTARLANCVRAHFAFEVIAVLGETEKAFRFTLRTSAQKTTRCGVCGAKLTNKSSVLTGIGPLCAEKLGIAQTLEDLADKLKTTIEVTRWLPKTAIKEQFNK